MAKADPDDSAKGGDEKLLDDAREVFKLCEEIESDNRKNALDDIRFARLGEQWPTEIRQQRELEGRPCLTENRLPAFTRQVVNDCRQNKPGIKVRPVDSGADPKTAEVFSGLIRNIEVTSNAEVAYDTAVEQAVDGGFGYIRVNIEYAHDDTFDKDLKIERVTNQFSVYADPHSTAADSADWDDAFITEMVPKKEFKRRYPKATMADWDADSWRKTGAPWSDEEQVMVAEWWHREEVTRTIIELSNGEIVDQDWLDKPFTDEITNAEAYAVVGITPKRTRETKSWKVTQRLMTGCEILETTVWPGRYIPVIPVYGEEVNVEGKRHLRSLVRNAKDPQRMYNYWLTTTTEMVALQPKAPFIGPKGAFESDLPKWQTANTSNHAFLEYDNVGGGAPQRQPMGGVPAGAMQNTMMAADGIKSTLGMFNASLGQRSNETSGVAINARKLEGDVSNFHFIDNLSRAIRHTGRVLIDLIPHVYTGERMVRILGPDGTAASVQLGQEAQQAPPQPGQPPQMPGQPPMPGQAPPPPIPAEVFNLSAGKYDLVVEAGPSFSTRREEAAQSMMDLIHAFPQAASVLGDLIAKNLDWPEADTVAQRLRSLLPPAAQGPDPQVQQVQQQAQQQVQQAQQQAADLAQQLKQAQDDSAAKARELEIKGFEAQTERMKVEGENTHKQQKLLLDASRPMPAPHAAHMGA